MKVKELIEELETKDSFKEFKDLYPNAFFTAGFFIQSISEKENDKIQIDFYIPEKENFCSFEYPFNSYNIHKDIMKDAKKLDPNDFTIDLDNIRDEIKNELHEEYDKIISVIQNNIWNVTCLNGIQIKRIKIDAVTKEFIFNDSLGINDIMKFKQ